MVYNYSTGVVYRAIAESATYTYQLFVTLGNPSDASTQAEFLLDEFTI